ncbi:unnamed protein product [Musa acuminata subsp. malaccensis]|uniref:(wild Malaysian banana) hypothetical protein n=1 Tax=Musa acuminata subsp. malaccensis TaxID=214687 RepID=A0A804IH19_MUSAM|nr:unnamed protein product [Musa acuminata subsp. malaccensis]
MDKLPKSQVAKMVLFLFSLIIIPFVSTSLRSYYLYFLFNTLIIALGIEAGLLNMISGPRDEKINAAAAAIAVASAINVQEAVHDAQAAMPAEATRVQKLKRCSSRPNLFFIDNDQVDGRVEEEEEAEFKCESNGELSKQELFVKAEAFIANFHKQLKLQREESWKQIHGIYHRDF